MTAAAAAATLDHVVVSFSLSLFSPSLSPSLAAWLLAADSTAFVENEKRTRSRACMRSRCPEMLCLRGAPARAGVASVRRGGLVCERRVL